MGIYTAIVRELVHAGISGEELIAALERVEAQALPAVDTAAERRRNADRERKKDERERLRKSAESADAPPFDKEKVAPKEITIPTSSLRSETKQGARASRIPEDFRPDLSEAIRLGLSPADAEREGANFIDYWHQANGPTAVKRDWPAAWRVWCRKAVQQRGNSNRGPPRGRSSGLDALGSALFAVAGQINENEETEREIKRIGGPH